MKRRHSAETDSAFEEFLAELTDAAYRAALRQGLQGAFIDTELALWRELRPVLTTRWNAMPEVSAQPAARSPWQEAAENGILAGSR